MCHVRDVENNKLRHGEEIWLDRVKARLDKNNC